MSVWCVLTRVAQIITIQTYNPAHTVLMNSDHKPKLRGSDLVYWFIGHVLPAECQCQWAASLQFSIKTVNRMTRLYFTEFHTTPSLRSAMGRRSFSSCCTRTILLARFISVSFSHDKTFARWANTADLVPCASERLFVSILKNGNQQQQSL